MATVTRPMMLGAIGLAIGLMTAAGEARAEEPPPRYMMVRCIKCPGGKGDAYRDYMLATTAKSMASARLAASVRFKFNTSSR